MVFLIVAMLLLQTSVSICTATLKNGKMCLGAVGRHRTHAATLTVYTREGPVEGQHVEHRCKVCGTGYWHGYYTQVS